MRRIPFGLVLLLAACAGSDINQPTAGSVRVTATTTGEAVPPSSSSGSSASGSASQEEATSGRSESSE